MTCVLVKGITNIFTVGSFQSAREAANFAYDELEPQGMDILGIMSSVEEI